MPSISVRRLFSDNQHKLELAWAAGNSGADNRIGVEADKPVLALVGHLNFIHPNQIQVVGVAKPNIYAVWNRANSAMISASFSTFPCLWSSSPTVLPVSPKLRDYCHTNSILADFQRESPHLMDVLRIYLQRTWQLPPSSMAYFWMYLKWAYSLLDNPAWVERIGIGADFARPQPDCR